jgi:hypothetical protein
MKKKGDPKSMIGVVLFNPKALVIKEPSEVITLKVVTPSPLNH